MLTWSSADELLNPAKGWSGTASFESEVNKLAELFNEKYVLPTL